MDQNLKDGDKDSPEDKGDEIVETVEPVHSTDDLLTGASFMSFSEDNHPLNQSKHSGVTSQSYGEINIPVESTRAGSDNKNQEHDVSGNVTDISAEQTVLDDETEVLEIDGKRLFRVKFIQDDEDLNASLGGKSVSQSNIEQPEKMDVKNVSVTDELNNSIGKSVDAAEEHLYEKESLECQKDVDRMPDEITLRQGNILQGDDDNTRLIDDVDNQDTISQDMSEQSVDTVANITDHKQHTEPDETLAPLNVTDDIEGAPQEVTEDTQRVTPEVTDDTQGVTPEVTDDTQGVTPEVTDDTQVVTPEVTDDTQGVTPEVTDDTQGVTPEVTDDTQEVTPEVTDDTQGVTPEVTDDTQEIPPEVTDDTQEIPPEVTDDTQEIPPEVTDDTQEIPPEVTDDTQEIPPEVTSDTQVVPPEVTDDTQVVPSEVTDVTQVVPSEVTDEAQEIPPEVTDDSQVVLPEVTDDTQEVIPKVTDDTQGVPPEVTDDTQEVIPEVTDDTQEIPPEVTDDTQGVPPEVTDDTQAVPSELTDEAQEIPPEVTDDTQVVPPEVTDDTQVVRPDVTDDTQEIPPVTDGTGVPSEVTDGTQEVTSKVTDETQEIPPEVTDDTQEVTPEVTDDTQEIPPELTSDTQVVPPEVTDDTQVVPPEVTDDTQEVIPEVTDDSQVVPSEVTDDTQEVPPGVTDDTQEIPPEVTSDTQVVPPEVTDDTQGVPPEVTDDTQAVLSEVTDDTQEVPPGVTDDTQEIPPEVTSDTQEVTPEVTDDTQETSPGVTDDTQEIPPEVTDDTQEIRPEVTDDTQEIPPEVTDDTQEIPPEVTSDTQVVPPEVTDDTQVVPSEVTDDTQEIPPEVTSDTQVVPPEVKDVTQVVPSEVTDEAQEIPPEVTDDTQVVPPEVTDDTQVVPPEVTDDTQEIPPVTDGTGVPSEVTDGTQEVTSKVTDETQEIPPEVTDGTGIKLEVTENTQGIPPEDTDDTQEVTFEVTDDTQNILPDVTHDTQEITTEIKDKTQEILPDVTEDIQGISLEVSDVKPFTSELSEDTVVLSDITDLSSIKSEIFESESDGTQSFMDNISSFESPYFPIRTKKVVSGSPDDQGIEDPADLDNITEFQRAVESPEFSTPLDTSFSNTESLYATAEEDTISQDLRDIIIEDKLVEDENVCSETYKQDETGLEPETSYKGKVQGDRIDIISDQDDQIVSESKTIDSMDDNNDTNIYDPIFNVTADNKSDTSIDINTEEQNSVFDRKYIQTSPLEEDSYPSIDDAYAFRVESLDKTLSADEGDEKTETTLTSQDISNSHVEGLEEDKQFQLESVESQPDVVEGLKADKGVETDESENNRFTESEEFEAKVFPVEFLDTEAIEASVLQENEYEIQFKETNNFHVGTQGESGAFIADKAAEPFETEKSGLVEGDVLEPKVFAVEFIDTEPMEAVSLETDGEIQEKDHVGRQMENQPVSRDILEAPLATSETMDSFEDNIEQKVFRVEFVDENDHETFPPKSTKECVTEFSRSEQLKDSEIKSRLELTHGISMDLAEEEALHMLQAATPSDISEEDYSNITDQSSTVTEQEVPSKDYEDGKYHVHIHDLNKFSYFDYIV